MRDATRVGLNASRGARARRLMALLALTTLVAGTGVGISSAQEAPPEEPPPVVERPNIIVIVTDDQRADQTLAAMPRTAELFGTEGTNFTDAYATTPLCCPARASIMTGLYVHNHGVRKNGYESVANLDHSLTMQRYLNDAGYYTGIFGKFFNGWDLTNTPPHFDEWAIFRHGYEDMEWNVNGQVVTLPDYSTNYIRRQALEFVEERAGAPDPWMLYLAPYAPHDPAKVAPRFEDAPVPAFEPNPATLEIDSDPGGVSDKPATVREAATFGIDEAVERHDRQLRTLMSVDLMVDRLFETLERTGEADNTLAIFTSDNGYMWAEHGLTGKAVPYLQSTRIPLLMRWPGRVAPAIEDARIAANIDIAPTILEAAGLAPAEEMDGRSLLQPTTRERLLLETFGRTLPGRYYWLSTITKDFQYSEWYLENSTTVPEFVEFYDLASDPWQLHNAVVEPSAETTMPNYPGLALQLRLDRDCRGATCP